VLRNAGEGDLSAGQLEEKVSSVTYFNATKSVNERLIGRRDDAGIPTRTY
jgi:hypothetical protein